MLPGDRAFTLHDTYGFPVEVTRELCDERGIEVIWKLRPLHGRAARARSRCQYEGRRGGLVHLWRRDERDPRGRGPTEFLGYTKNDAEARVLALVKDGVQVDVLEAGDEGRVVLDATPFYAEKAARSATRRACEGRCHRGGPGHEGAEKGLIAHTVKVESGRLSAGDAVHAAIDVPRRERIRRNHTATHILHWALREVLGDHVKQAGSYVADSVCASTSPTSRP